MCHGFGPSIEYEIVSQPSVVDLLISFCYSAAKLNRLKGFPVGMGLRVPHHTCTGYNAHYNRLTRELVFENGDGRPPIGVGSWIAITVLGNPVPEWHCRIIETVHYPKVKLGPLLEIRYAKDDVQKEKIDTNLTTNHNGKESSAISTIASEGVLIPGKTNIVQVSFRIYNCIFDNLDTSDQMCAIIKVLDMMPRVSAMQAWLKMNPKVAVEKGLKGWSSRMSPASIGILRWIIASNRSCIIPLTNDEEQKVQGVPGCMQFRFAMGAPDKEQRFVNSVRSVQRKLNPDCEFSSQ
jgi:ubiquitin-conjugating enzyme E2 Q